VKLSDAKLADLERLANAAIDEIVFMKKHAEDDQLEEAAICGHQACMNLEQVAIIIEEVA
jgi:hypothetical protein